MEPKDVEAREDKLVASIEKLQQAVGDLRVEMLKGDASLRQAMIEGDAALRDEMKQGDSSLRLAMTEGFARLQEQIIKLEGRMTRLLFQTQIWMMGLTGGMLYILAKGFKWI